MLGKLNVCVTCGSLTCACRSCLPAEVKSAETVGPVLIHIVTEKGRGYLPAETASDKMHGVVKFDPKTGKQQQPKATVGSYTNYFAGVWLAMALPAQLCVLCHCCRVLASSMLCCHVLQTIHSIRAVSVAYPQLASDPDCTVPAVQTR